MTYLQFIDDLSCLMKNREKEGEKGIRGIFFNLGVQIDKEA